MPAVVTINDKSEDHDALDKTYDGAEDTSSKKYSNSEDLSESSAHQQTKIVHSAFLTEVDDEEYEVEEEEDEEEIDSNSNGNQTSTIFISLNSEKENPIEEIQSDKIEENQVESVNNKISEVSFEVNTDKQQQNKEKELHERSEISIQIGSTELQDSSETLSFVSHRLVEPNEILDVKNEDELHEQVSETSGEESFAHLGHSFVAHQVALFSADLHEEPKEVVESSDNHVESSEPPTYSEEAVKTEIDFDKEKDASISFKTHQVDSDEEVKEVVELSDSHVESSEPPTYNEESLKTEINLDKEKDASISFEAHQVDSDEEVEEVVELLDNHVESSEPPTYNEESLKTEIDFDKEKDASISFKAHQVAHFDVDLDEEAKVVVESSDSHVKSSEQLSLSEELVKTEINLDKEKNASISFVAHQVSNFFSGDVDVAKSSNNDDPICVSEFTDDNATDETKGEERSRIDFIEESGNESPVDFEIESKEEVDNPNNNSKAEADSSVNSSIIDVSPIKCEEESESDDMKLRGKEEILLDNDSFVAEASEYSEDEESVVEEIIQEVIIQPLGTKCDTEFQDGDGLGNKFIPSEIEDYKEDVINNNLIHTSTQEYHVLKDEEFNLSKKNKDTYKSEITIELDSVEDNQESSKPEEETSEEVIEKSIKSETEAFQDKKSSKLIKSEEGDGELEINNKILEQNINSELNANKIQDDLEQSNNSTDHIVMEPVNMDISYTGSLSQAPDSTLEETDISSEFQFPNNEEIGPSDAIDVTKVPNLQESAIKDSLEELTHREVSRSANAISKASDLKTDFVQELSQPVKGLASTSPIGNSSITPESHELIEPTVNEHNDSSQIISNDFPYSREELTCMGIAFLALLIGFLIQFF